jgi:hypothetical protein
VSNVFVVRARRMLKIRKLRLQTHHFREHERRACAARLTGTGLRALRLAGLTRVHSTTRQPDVLALEAADCATIYRSSQSRHRTI